MPEIRIANYKKMRLGVDRAAGRSSRCLGERTGFNGRVPEVAYHRAEHRLVEEFLVWKRLNLALSFEVNVRQAEAFLILEEQLDLEKQSGTE
jgi:hypothetical protein